MKDVIQILEMQMTCRHKPLPIALLKGIIMSNIETSTISATATLELANDVGTVVVQNDTVTTDAAQASASVRNHFEQLAVEREAWENTVYRTSNEQLYVLLQKCYQTYQAMTGTEDEASALRAGLNDYINTKGYKFNTGTHTLVKIVKCVFGADRRRVSAYGIVLRTALAKKISAVDLPQFIRTQGGVEEIRLAKSPNAMTAKQKAAKGADAVQSASMGVFSSATLGTKLDAGNIGKAVVLIGTWQADGSVIVRSVVENDSAVNVALACHYSANKVEAKEAANQKQAANDEQVKQDAITEAVQAAVVNA
jgi:hypothetical protein